MKNSVAITLALALALFGAGTAGAAEGQTNSFFVGGAIGNAFLSTEIEDAGDQIKDIDENSTAWKIFAGFSGHKFLGIEGGYRDFGKIDLGDDSLVLTSKTTGWDVEALGRIRIAFLDIFGKAGVMFWKTEVEGADDSASETNTDFFWGLGAGARLGPIGVRLEWENLELEGPTNLAMVSLGATLGF